LIFAIVAAVLLLISSSLIADDAESVKGFTGWIRSWLDKLRAAAVNILKYVIYNTTMVGILQGSGSWEKGEK